MTSLAEPPAYGDPRDLHTLVVDSHCSPPAFGASWTERSGALRRQVIAAAGLWEDPADRRAAPPAEVFERTDHPDLGYSVEKVYFESLPGYHVTGNLFRPSGRAAAGAGRRPAVLNPHGHWEKGRFHHDALGSTFARCMVFARMGFVAFCHDMIGYGDNTQIPHRWGGPAEWIWGCSPLGLQLWNSMRALDFLASLPDVDPEHIACTGESGGGTQTYLVSALDPRVTVSAPVNMVSLDYQGGCACESAPGLRLDTSNVEIAGLIAPRPLLIVCCTGDWTARMPEDGMPALQTLYGDLGAADRVAWHREVAPHNYNRGSREAVYRFLARWLPAQPLGAADIPDETLTPDPDAEPALRVFARRGWPAHPEGQAAVDNVRGWYQGRAEERLAAISPRDAAGVARLRAAVLPYLQGVTGVHPCSGQVAVRSGERGALWLSRRGAADRFPVLPADGGAAAPVTLRTRGGDVYGIWPYGAGRRDQPWGRAGRAVQSDAFLCYNRADAAWVAHDLLTALAWCEGAEELRADPACAVGALLARAISPEAVRVLRVDLRESDGWAGSDPAAPWIGGSHFLPGILCAGGLQGLIALAAPGRTVVRGAGPLSDAAAVYAALGSAEALAAGG